jgi:hypothetical protein
MCGLLVSARIAPTLGRMSMREIEQVLAELFVGETQAQVTSRLVDGGMVAVQQPKVSAWLRGRRPSLEQLAEIERIYGQPRGWILWRAGFIDAEALASLDYDGPLDEPASPADIDEVAQLRAEVDGLRADLRDLRDAVATRKARRRPPESTE